MKLIQATVKSNPRQVTTKFGDKTVLDCTLADGSVATLWRPADDTEALGRRSGERVTLAIDGKGKYHLMESLSTGLSDPYQKPPLTNGNTSRSAEIADYTERLAKLYSHTFKTVRNQMSDSGLPIECLKDVTTSLFIQTVRHFDL
ncbi:MAG: hypothetical protein ACRC11_03975 [Xenococcaceae cyanobacterium]